MRIALCADGRSPHGQRWANGLADRGHEVAFVWAADDLASADLSGFRPSVTHHAHLRRSQLRRPWWTPVALRTARRLAARLEPDVAHGLYLSIQGWTAHMLGVRPLVLSALGSDVFHLGRSGGSSIPRRAGDAYGVRRTRAAVAAADVVLTDSTVLAASLRERVPGTDVRIVRFGVVPDAPPPSARSTWRARLGIADDAFVVLSSRLVRPHYNIDDIVRALPAIRRRLPTSVLVLKEQPQLSDPDYRRLCLGLAEELGVRDAVRTVGELDRPELLELYAAADVYVSVPTTDGTAVSVLEAMAAGVAVVAADVPGIDPAILRRDETALLVPVHDPDSLASAVVTLGQIPTRESLVERAREVVRQYGDFDRELDRAVLLYEELVAARRLSGRGRRAPRAPR
jgi:glycosyltransferase involved in cell wall biosynthesis